MASSPGAADLSEIRALAHQLYAQCRDSTSAYKLLTSPVRKLRNVLEEAEEIFDETRTLGPDDLRLLERVGRSGSILNQLDLALKSHRSSDYANVDENAIADFKTVLDVTTHELSAAFEAISTGDIELRLDTNMQAYGAGASKLAMGMPSSSSIATDSARDSVHDRKSSCASSAWSLNPRDNFSQESASDSMSVRSESKTGRLLSDEKELSDFDGVPLQISPAVNSAVRSKPSRDWRSPFASPDPLSISIEEASAMILADDEEIVSATISSPSGTGSTVFVNGASDEGERSIAGTTTPSNGEETSMSTSTVTLQPVQDMGAPAENNIFAESNPDTVEESSVPEESSAPQVHEQSITIPLLPPQTEDDTNLLSPKSAMNETARRKHNSSVTSIDGVANPGEAMVEQIDALQTEPNLAPARNKDEPLPESNVAVRTDAAHEQPTRTEQTDEHLSIIDSTTRETVVPAEQISLKPAFDTAQMESEVITTDVNHAPSMPKRIPPPPPPRPRRRHVKKRASSYRIVNASPQESSSEDELYTTSKPSSPTTQTRTNPRINTHTTIPKVSIDASACEDDQVVGLGIRDANSPSQSLECDVQTSEGEQTGMEILASALRSKFNTGESSVSAFVPPEDTRSGPDVIIPTNHDPIPTRHSAAVPASQDAVEEEAPVLPPRRQPPPIPKRPDRSRYQRSRDQSMRPVPSTAKTSPAVLNHDKETSVEEKQSTPQPGVKAQQKLSVRPPHLRERVSVDSALNVGLLASPPHTASSLQDATRHFRSASVSQVDSTTSHSDPTFTGFYGPGTDSTSDRDLERERINHIVHFWNDCLWDQAEAYLTDYLTVLMQNLDLARARRVRHLMGVCASFKGEWLRAIPLFLFVMRTPIRDIAEIDDGDCAAAYWLGDTYSLLNRRTEALLAYYIAERSSLFKDPMHPSLGELTAAEQEAVQLGLPNTNNSTRWAQAFSTSAEHSILNTNVINTSTAMTLFDNEPRKARKTPTTPEIEPFRLNQNTPRSQAFFKLTGNPWAWRSSNWKINASHFEPNTTWPLMYDPLFVMANVQRGRLLAYECDLLAVYKTNMEAKVPKASPLGLGRMDCFTCSDLSWLIRTIRECLKVLEMEFSEVANVEGTWFVVRYTFMQNKIATTNYFSIALFKQTLRSGYGAEICPDGICSARIIRVDVDYDRGVHVSESKRIKKLVREYLDEAAKQKQRPKSRRKESSSNTAQRGSDVVEQETPPPIPPRPNSSPRIV